MGETTGLFGTNKYCEFCNRPLPPDYEQNYCPTCLDNMLFREVKEYIRTHDVNEYDVAAHFNLPVHKVKSWIREGRIEYKEHSNPGIEGLHCQRCGAPVTFGSLCPKCLKQMNNSIHVYGSVSKTKDSQMFYLDQENNKRNK